MRPESPTAPLADPILLEPERRRRVKAQAASAPPRGRQAAAGDDSSQPLEADPEARPHIKPGYYEVAYQSAEKARFWGRDRWVIRFVVVEPGAANGIVLEMYANVPPETATN